MERSRWDFFNSLLNENVLAFVLITEYPRQSEPAYGSRFPAKHRAAYVFLSRKAACMVPRRIPTTKKGKQGEDHACRFLKRKGFKILERNYRNRFGEIDIVAEQSGDLVFVEVRSLSSVSRHLPEETINVKKQQRLSRAAVAYIQEKGLEHRPARFDVVSVETEGRTPRLRHLPDAFEIWEF